MIVVGMLCRKWKILTRDGINNMKVLVTNVMLPVAIFHALATAEYNKETGILILIMFCNAGSILWSGLFAEAISERNLSEISTVYGKRI